MKIAILDSGLDMTYYKENIIIGGCTFQYVNDNIENIENEFWDDNGHGTKTFQIIKQYGSSNNKYYIIKILDKNNETTVEILICALKYLLDLDIDIIHLSLAIVEQEFEGKAELSQVCKELAKKNKILVCAQQNKTNIPSYPAALNSVLGVDSIYSTIDDEIWYDAQKIIQCYSNAVPKLVKGLNDRYVFFGGTSKSAAVVTGILTANMEMQVDNNLECILSKLAIRHTWEVDSDRECSNKFRQYNLDRCIHKKYSQDKYHIVKKTISEVLKISSEIDYFTPLAEQNINLNGEEAKQLLESLENQFLVKINFDQIFYTSMYSFNSIIDLFFRGNNE